MFLLRLRAGRFVLCGPGFSCPFNLGWRGATMILPPLSTKLLPLLCCFFFPSIPFCHPRGEGKKRWGGVTWYLLVPILHPLFFIHLRRADGSTRCRRAAITVQYQDIHHIRMSRLYWKKEDFSKASPIIWLNWSYITWVLRFVVFVSSILEEPPASLPSRTLSPKALLHSFDTHQGVQRAQTKRIV